MMTEMKLPACYAVIDENEMTYLDGGATIADSDAYSCDFEHFYVALLFAAHECRPILLAFNDISNAFAGDLLRQRRQRGLKVKF